MADKQKKKCEILNSAYSVFKEKGFHKSKMEEIAEKAGVGKGTLYEYFSSKQDLFGATYEFGIMKALDEMEAISSTNVNFKDKLIAMFEYKIKCFNLEGMSIEDMFSVKNIISEKTAKDMINHINSMNKILIDIIDQGKTEGQIRLDVPSKVIACAVMGTSREYFKLKLFEEEYNKKQENYDEIFDLFFNGFGVK